MYVNIYVYMYIYIYIYICNRKLVVFTFTSPEKVAVDRGLLRGEDPCYLKNQQSFSFKLKKFSSQVEFKT